MLVTFAKEIMFLASAIRLSVHPLVCYENYTKRFQADEQQSARVSKKYKLLG